MNILVIGNGFDLAHGLPTTYMDFLKFCENVKLIYKSQKVDKLSYVSFYLKDYQDDERIKKVLVEAFNERRKKEVAEGEERDPMEPFTTPDEKLNEFYAHIGKNIWIEYFLKRKGKLGENWIDFEMEISRVVQCLDEGRKLLVKGRPVADVSDWKEPVLKNIASVVVNEAGTSVGKENLYKDVESIDKFIKSLEKDLMRLIRALEIYLSEFVGKIDIEKRVPEIQQLSVDYVLSFNYTETYKKLYDDMEQAEYDYIHGKADIHKNVENCNMVLGIDEYLPDDRKDKETEFLFFKKYFQRIYKSTGNHYLEWVEDIKTEYEGYITRKNNAHANVVKMIETGDLSKFPYQEQKCMEMLNEEEPAHHNLYIFGHSLDVTDGDILKMLICNENVQTKIFYYRKNEDDKEAFKKIIENLVKIMGQDELIRRTGGLHRTIEFIPQQVEKVENHSGKGEL